MFLHMQGTPTHLVIWVPAVLLPSGDGTCTAWLIDDAVGAEVIRLTGPGIDHLTAITVSQDHIYTSCRDGYVRTYMDISNILH